MAFTGEIQGPVSVTVTDGEMDPEWETWPDTSRFIVEITEPLHLAAEGIGEGEDWPLAFTPSVPGRHRVHGYAKGREEAELEFRDPSDEVLEFFAFVVRPVD